MNKKLDLTGQRYGILTVIKEVEGVRVGKKQVHKRRWLCRCDCGNEITVITDSLRNGNTQSCGCIKPINISNTNLEDLTGKRFGMLTVIERMKRDTKLLTAFWKCQCDCGEITVVSATNLKSGNTKSCGHKKKSNKRKYLGVYPLKSGRWKAIIRHNKKYVYQLNIFLFKKVTWKLSPLLFKQLMITEEKSTFPISSIKLKKKPNIYRMSV